MNEDVELKAMSIITEALSGLEADVVARVLTWAASRFGLQLGDQRVRRQERNEDTSKSGPPLSSASFERVIELFDATDPETESEKALVVGYWFQVLQGSSDLTSFQINKELKQIGHPVKNITNAMDGLIKRTPRLAMQTSKSGKERQSRKRFRLTSEGIKKVTSMIETPRSGR
jgi:hypothetical protein